MSAASVVPAPSSEKAVAKVKIDLKASRLSLSKPPSVTFDPMAVNETNNQPVINLNNNNEIDAKKAVTEKVGNQLVPAALVHQQQPSIANQERVPTPSRNNEVTSSGGSVPKDLTQVFFRLILLKHVKKSRTSRTYVVTHFRQFMGVPLCYSSVFRHLFCYCAAIML